MTSNQNHFLIVDGYPKESREELSQAEMTLAGILYGKMLKLYRPNATYDIWYASDEDQSKPTKDHLQKYQGLLWPGCNLTAYHTEDLRVRNMLDLVSDAFQLGIPQYGSCWGIQVACIVAGGKVQVNPKGREMGIARNIFLSEEGKKHPMFQNKSPVFAGYESHEDEVTQLPPKAILLASNSFTHIQAAQISYGKGTFWACQYHPEYNLHEMGSLIAARGQRLTNQGFFATQDDVKNMVEKYKSLHTSQQRKDLRWQLGIEDDLIVDSIRQREFINWLDFVDNHQPT